MIGLRLCNPRAISTCVRSYGARAFSTGRAVCAPLRLAFDVQEPGSTDKPVAKRTSALVVVHGLYGSKQNWRALAKAMARDFGVPVYALDLRNHGESPHADSMVYRDMASDVHRFLEDHSLSDVALVGHSLGGKVMMTYALDPAYRPSRVSRLVSVDMSPAAGAISKEFMVCTAGGGSF